MNEARYKAVLIKSVKDAQKSPLAVQRFRRSMGRPAKNELDLVLLRIGPGTLALSFSLASRPGALTAARLFVIRLRGHIPARFMSPVSPYPIQPDFRPVQSPHSIVPGNPAHLPKET